MPQKLSPVLHEIYQNITANNQIKMDEHNDLNTPIFTTNGSIKGNNRTAQHNNDNSDDCDEVHQNFPSTSPPPTTLASLSLQCSPSVTATTSMTSTSTASVPTKSSPSPISLFDSINSLKRARIELNSTEINNNNSNNSPTVFNEFPCSCGQIISDSSEFLQHVRQCQEFMMTASNFAEVIAMNTAMTMSSKWSKSLLNPILEGKNNPYSNDYKFSSFLTHKQYIGQDDNHSQQSMSTSKNMSHLIKYPIQEKDHTNTTNYYNANSYQSALDLSFHSNGSLHSPSISNATKHNCPECTTFSSTERSVLLKHFEVQHDRIGNFTCSKCCQSYDYLPYYLKHQVFDNCSILTSSSTGNLSAKMGITKSVTLETQHENDYSNSTIQHHNHQYYNDPRSRNHSSTRSPSPSSPCLQSPRIKSINEHTNDIHLLNKKLICNACNKSGFSHTTELITHLTQCPKFTSLTTENVGSSHTNTSVDSSNIRINNELLSLALGPSVNSKVSVLSSANQNNDNNSNNTRGSPAITGLMNSSPFDFDKSFSDVLKASFNSQMDNNSCFSPNRISSNVNSNDKFSNTTPSNNYSDKGNHKGNNHHHHHHNLLYTAHATETQTSYTNFISSLQSFEKSLRSGITTKSSSVIKSENEKPTNLSNDQFMMGNGNDYSSIASVSSLLMNDFGVNQRYNHNNQLQRHPNPDHMKDLKFSQRQNDPVHQHQQQQQQQQHQHQQNNSNNSVPSSVMTESTTDLSRPFKCCHCIKAFKSKALLDQHMHIHYPPKYTCRYCAKKYRWPPVFYHHQRTCKKRPPSTTCTNNDTNNSTITVTMSTQSNHTNNNSSGKRNSNNMNYLTSEIGKSFPLNSESFFKPSTVRSTNRQGDDKLHGTSTTKKSDRTTGGSGTFSPYGHSSCFTPFNSDINTPSSFMELANNPALLHNSIFNNSNSSNDLSLMSSSNLNNFATLAAAAAAAAMSMHFQIPSISSIPPLPPLGFSNTFPSSSTSSSSPISSLATGELCNRSFKCVSTTQLSTVNNSSSSAFLTSMPSSSTMSSSPSSDLFSQPFNRSNPSLPFSNQSVFPPQYLVPPFLMPNSSEMINSNYLNESNIKSEPSFPFNNFSTQVSSSLNAVSSLPSTVVTSESNDNSSVGSASSQFNILNNLLCICGMRFNEISSYLSHVTACNYLKNLVQQQQDQPLSTSLTRTDNSPSLSPTSESSSSSSSPSTTPPQQVLSQSLPGGREQQQQHLSTMSSSFLSTLPQFQSSSLSHIFPFNLPFPPLSNMSEQYDLFNRNKKMNENVSDVNMSPDCSPVRNTVQSIQPESTEVMNKKTIKQTYDTMNEKKFSGNQKNLMEYEESYCRDKDLTSVNKMYNRLDGGNEKDSLSEIHSKGENHNQLDSSQNELTYDKNDRNNGSTAFDLKSVLDLPTVMSGKSQSSFDEYDPDSAKLLEQLSTDDKLNTNPSNNSFVTAMANVLANAAAAAGFHCPGLPDPTNKPLTNQHSSPSPVHTPSDQPTTNYEADSVEIMTSESHSQRNSSNNSPDNVTSMSTTTTTTPPTTMNSPKSCYQCGKEFSSRLSLKQHVEGKHSTEGKYCCPGCSKRYRWGASYYYHKKSCPAVREQSPVSSDIINQLSLSGSEDDSSSRSSINSSPDLQFNPTPIQQDDDMEVRNVEENDAGDDDDEELEQSSNNSPRECLNSPVNNQRKSDGIEESLSSKSNNPNEIQSIPSKVIKQKLSNKHKKACQNLKTDSLLCDIKAFPLETNS
uniref:C2H2-type domain-containing protein n=1 Tax=Trichobilharzia regenti TaxID=157069 RepID=A0AA85IKW2_TRIRE|nr:unnamed protein product [Trichobilharzia regenti]